MNEQEVLSLAKRFARSQVGKDPGSSVVREVAEDFGSYAWTKLRKSAESWRPDGGRSIKNYAWNALEWAWKDRIRDVAAQQGGHVPLADVRETQKDHIEGIVTQGDVHASLQGTPDPNTRYVTVQGLRGPARMRFMKKTGAFFGTTPRQELTPREAEVVGRYIFTAGYPRALDAWQNHDYDGVLHLADLHRGEPTARELASLMMPDHKGRLLAPSVVRDYLSSACAKFGLNKRDLYAEVKLGVYHTRVRARITAGLD